MRADADRQLLVGLLALQHGLIDDETLLAAIDAWARDRGRGLAEHLEARGDLDAGQRARLEALVTSQRPDVEATLSRIASGDTATGATDRVGGDGRRFRILRPHARGGLGAVFVAMDEELHREVALKQILDGHADKATSRGRFVQEAEITGGLEHPGIVPVYGLGTYADGRPYYAMRFIRGDTLAEVIERFHRDASARHDPGHRSLELRKLLRRFQDVCNAIEYAHARGVLHRDIKPANVIVGRHGETLVVDWGLAKVLGRNDPAASDERPLMAHATSGSIETQAGTTLGTPSFMSPEQARGDLEHLGPQADVYSLGATLYSILTGRAPVEPGELGAMLRIVHEGTFPPPRQLDPSLDPALEAVCLKAMALRPEDRYPSAKSLAEELDRWMADEPVAAWREPLVRRARRWARQNRTAVAATGMAVAAGVIGLGAIVGVQSRANTHLRRSQAETQAALQQSEAVSSFLVQAFRSPDPARDGRDVKVVEVLDKANETLDKEFKGSQATHGVLLDALGETYRGLGLSKKAVDLQTKARTLLESALGPDHPQTLEARNDLANALVDAGRRPEAIALRESTLKLFESKLGPNDPRTLQCRNDLGADYWFAGDTQKAIAMHEETLRRREATLGAEHEDTLQSRQNLAISYGTAGLYQRAIPMFQEVLALQVKTLGSDNPDALETRNDLAGAFRETGRLSEAAALDEEVLRRREATLGPNHPQTISSRGNLALDYSALGRRDEAIALAKQTLEVRAASLGPDHPDTLVSRLNLADMYTEAGRTAEALALNETTLPKLKATFGADHPYTLIGMSNLASSYLQTGRLDEAIALLQSTIPACEAKLGAADYVTLFDRGQLALAYESLHRRTEAEALWRESLARRRASEKPDPALVAEDLAMLGRNLLAQSKWTEAEGVLRDSFSMYEKTPADDWKRYQAMSLLGGALAGQGRYADAEPLLVPGYQGMKERESRIGAQNLSRLHEAAARVVRLYEAWGKPDKATEWKATAGGV